jgi:6-pyruvoyltetrahydropterin/6-carboxytetrahydropterin synthase
VSTEIVKEFRFDAAHFLPTVPEGHRYRRLHGHSFHVEVALRGDPDPRTGWIIDLGVAAVALGRLRERLDHTLLNDIVGLEVPTLERIARWIYEALAPDLPGLARVTIRRESEGESCTFKGVRKA